MSGVMTRKIHMRPENLNDKKSEKRNCTIMNEKTKVLTGLAKDTLAGLTSQPKYLLPKYFYDDRGSSIFGKIMNMPEYYLTDSEMEILSGQKEEIASLSIDRELS